MRILLVNFSIRENAPRLHLPMGLAYIASSLNRAGCAFDILDLAVKPLNAAEIEQFFERNDYDIVATGCIVTGYKIIKRCIEIIKKCSPGTTVIVGNTVASSIPEILLSKTQADIAVMGEGDKTIVELVECLQTKGDIRSVKGFYFKEDAAIRTTGLRPHLDLDSLPFPDWSLFNLEKYIQSFSGALNEPLPPIPREQIRSVPINVSRGCPFRCSFCYHAFKDYPYRRRSTESIVREMERLCTLYQINHFVFCDDLALANAEDADKLAEALLKSGLEVYWEINCRSGAFYSERHFGTLKKMKEAGALSIGFSLESSNPEILKWMNKQATAEQFLSQAKLIKKSGLGVRTSLVFGYPIETEHTIKNTIDCCLEAGVYPSAGFLLPQPGTPIYNYAREMGKLGEEEDYLLAMGDRQDLRINLTQITDEQLEGTVLGELERLSNELGIGLSPDKLIRTGYQRKARRLPE